jgi:pSer/pThr/pTyr-binding forkhead associated (FHA) protein
MNIVENHQNAPLFFIKILTGKKKGQRIPILKKRIQIGRESSCEICLSDDGVSKNHAEISFYNKKIFVTDLNSQNGVFVNELKVKQSPLNFTDKLIVGRVVMGLESALGEEEVAVEKNEEIPKPQEEKKKTNWVVVIAILLFGGLIFLETSNDTPPDVKAKIQIDVRDIGQTFLDQKTKMNEVDPEIKEKIDAILHRGLRELREGNYFRAMSEFNLALVMNPNNPRAAFYIEKAKSSLDNKVKDIMIRGEREMSALKYHEAKVSFCTAIRTLQNIPSDERYKTAEEKVKSINTIIGLKSEVDCE